MDTDGYARVNGLNMYYEVSGDGQPLILLHGGFGTVDMFKPIWAVLAVNRQVVGVELQGHGHTADADRPLSFEQLADDVAVSIKQLGHANADIMGYSLGGGVAIQTAIRHPEVVRKLVIVSAPCRSDGWYPQVLQGQRSITAEIAKTWIGSPMHQAYARVAPQPDDWTTLAAKTSDLLRRDYDWSKEVTAIKAPTLIALGDADAVRTAHATEFFELLGGGRQDAGWDGSGMSKARLAILPGMTHYNILESPLLVPAVKSFLDTP